VSPTDATRAEPISSGTVDSPAMSLTKRTVPPPKGGFCFGCNQAFSGGEPALKFESDLPPPSDRAELAGLCFHPGHLIRYARRRNWTELADFIELNGAGNY